MDFKQLIPADITKLPTYSVSRELFVCTAILLGILLGIALGIAIFWAYRIKNGFLNLDYMIDFNVKNEVQRTIHQIPNNEIDDENVPMPSLLGPIHQEMSPVLPTIKPGAGVHVPVGGGDHQH